MSEPVEPEALLDDCAFLNRLARRLVHDPHRADDAVQDAWIEASRTENASVHNRRGWLATILRNFIRQDVRQVERRTRRESDAARSERTPSAFDSLERLALQRRVVEAVESLEEPFRSAIVMRFFDDLPPREIAKRTGAPVKTANNLAAFCISSSFIGGKELVAFL